MALIPIAAMVRKDLQLFFSDRRAVIMSFLVPIAIASFFGSIFSGPSRNAEPARIAVAIVDHGSVIADDTLAGLQSRFAAAGPATLESMFLTLTGRSLRD